MCKLTIEVSPALFRLISQAALLDNLTLAEASERLIREASNARQRKAIEVRREIRRARRRAG